MKVNNKGVSLVEVMIVVGLMAFIGFIVSIILNNFINLRRLAETDVGVTDYVHSISAWLRSPKTFPIPGIDSNYNPASSCTGTFYGKTFPEEVTQGVWNGVDFTIPVGTDGSEWKYNSIGMRNFSGLSYLAKSVELTQDIRIAAADGLQVRFRKPSFVSQDDRLIKNDGTETKRKVLQIRLKLEVQTPGTTGVMSYRKLRDIFFETLVETEVAGNVIRRCVPEVSLHEACRIQGGTFDEDVKACIPGGPSGPERFCEYSGSYVVSSGSGTVNNPFTGGPSCPSVCPPTWICPRVCPPDCPSYPPPQGGYLISETNTEKYYTCMRCN